MEAPSLAVAERRGLAGHCFENGAGSAIEIFMPLPTHTFFSMCSLLNSQDSGTGEIIIDRTSPTLAHLLIAVTFIALAAIACALPASTYVGGSAFEVLSVGP
jgi:hypothetical protein